MTDMTTETRALVERLRQVLFVNITAPPNFASLLTENRAMKDEAAAVITTQAETIAALHARLEMDHAFQVDPTTGEAVRISVEPGTIPDGISCRDATIELQDDVIAELTAERDRLASAIRVLGEAVDGGHREVIFTAISSARAALNQP